MGGGDAGFNPRLRLAVEKAKAVNMPADNIDRAIKKGTGELEGMTVEEIAYEGYGPGGVAVLVETLTDNRNRTVGELRHLFSKHGGNLAASGAVAFLFQKRGNLSFELAGIDGDALMEAAMEADALDVREGAGTIEVETAPERFEATRKALEAKGFRPTTAEVAFSPTTQVKLTGNQAQSMLKLYEALDEHEDVKQVYANFDISEEEMVQLAEAS
jgi:YebC/PmpR family DNA-binding regulatory protein